MGFLQIIDFHTDQYDEFVRLERQWVVDTDGQRTSVGGQLYADRDDPTHFVALDWFTDYDSAMVNSALPGTSAFAEKATALSTGDVVFHNLEPADMEVFIQGEPELRTALETSTLPRHAFADDVELDMIVPHGRVTARGVDALEAIMREESAGRTLTVWDTQATMTGFVAEYAYRTHDDADSVAVGSALVRVHEGRIARIYLTCGGNWDVETQERVRRETGELGSGLVTSQS
jgi:quinol monooxygenase YgiN